MSRLKYILVSIIVVIALVVIADLLVGVLLFKPNTTYNGIQEYLQKNTSAPLYTPQPFLNYTNNTGSVTDDGVHQINTLGIRHPLPVEIPKPAHKLRILFLGGSTTYCEVAKTADGFPALLEKTIKDSLHLLPTDFNEVECLNAGLGAGTSAEILVQYLLKFKYLDADVVVIHAGINDAFTTAKIDNYEYQPDYHTSKRIMQNSTEVTGTMRILSHSNIAAYFIINHYFERQLKTDFKTNDFFEYHHKDVWFPHGNDSMFVPRYNAFYNNLGEMVSCVTGSGKKVLLVTEVIEPNKMPEELRTMLVKGIAKDKTLMIQLADECKVPVCILNKDEFTADYFIDGDGIHVNEKGELLKAEKIKPCLLTLIKQIK